MASGIGALNHWPAALSTPITIRLLGSFEVRVNGRFVDVGGRLRCLLAILAIAVPEGVQADLLAERIWGDAAPKGARGSLRVLIARLRRLVGPDLIITDSDGYRLSAASAQIDVLTFKQLLDTATEVRRPCAERQALVAALAFWRGAPFDGIDSEWLTDFERPRLVRRYLAAVERRIDLDLAAGAHRSLIAELRELISRYPFHEPLWRLLLRVLDATGRSAEALAAYEDFRIRLKGNLGVDPSPALRDAHARLLTGDAEPDYHNLLPRQLPTQLPTFTGRASALTQLDTFLAAAALGPGRPTAVAVIVGGAGVGKTALAVRWAHQAKDRFPGGQLFIDLNGYGPGIPTEPMTALGTMLSSLGVPGERIPVELEPRAALLHRRAEGRPTLLVLDNVRDAAQVRPLLPASSCLVLITSRHPIVRLCGNRMLQVEVRQMTSAEAVAFLRTAFLRRWVGHDSRRPGRRPSADMVPDETELVALAERCELLPLTLAIAAEHIQQSLRVDLSELDALAEHISTELNRSPVAGVPDNSPNRFPPLAAWS